jgi:Zn-dependent protease with chaperone function
MRCRTCLLALALLVTLAVPAKSFGQNVRYDNAAYGFFLHPFEQAARDQNPACWPLIPQGQKGTWALVTFDTQNCDITFVTRRSYPASSLLLKTMTVARLCKLPLANYIVVEGLHTRAIDLELNPYLVRSRFHTRISLPLGQIAAAIGKAGFPAPIAVAVDGSETTSCNLNIARHSTTIDNYWFAVLSDIPAGSTINFDAHLTWRSWLALVLMAAVFISLAIGPLIMLRKKKSETATEPRVLSPVEAQLKYNKSVPKWVLLLIPIVLFTLIPLLRMVFNHNVTVFDFLNQNLQPIGSAFLLLIVLTLTAVSSRINKRKTTVDSQNTSAQLPGNRKVIDPKLMLLPFGALLPMLALFMYTTFNPPLTFRQSRIDHWLIYACYAVGFSLIAYFVYSTFIAARGKKTPAPEQWRLMAFDLAKLRGVPIKRVVVLDLPLANAYATAFGTVGLTSRLLAEFPPEEVKAIIAHELGHLEAGHPQRRLVVVGAALVILNALIYFGMNYASTHASQAYTEWRQYDFIPILLVNPLLVITFGKWFRRNEDEADAFAVSATGDAETVIAALKHIHEVNGSPSRLRPADEAIASHPSLENRIKAIRNRSVVQQ